MRIKNFGPGAIVAAAFIGPGTITMCTIAGVNYGYDLLWTLLFSVLVTLFLQLMVGRIGMVTNMDLSTIIISNFKSNFYKYFSIFLILSAIMIGNIAYEAGNISGGVLGLESLFGTSKILLFDSYINVYSYVLGLIAFLILFLSNQNFVEKLLIFLVLIMSFSFVFSSILVEPDYLLILKGLLVPSLPDGSIIVIIGLIGTTVVPYNLFLHASLVKNKWNGIQDLKKMYLDTTLAILIGGLISVCIVITAANVDISDLNSAADLAISIEPVFGSFSKIIMCVGLFSAGLTSAVTAPLAVSYVVCGCLGWSASPKSKKFKFIWFFVLMIGVIFSSLNIKSVEVIKFAQVANGILLPLVAVFLIWIANKKELLAGYTNNLFQNFIAVLILGITTIIGFKSILKVFELI